VKSNMAMFITTAMLLRVSLTPLLAFAPVDLRANIVVGEGRTVRAEMDCDNGYYSSSTWDREDRPTNLTFRVKDGGKCTLSVVVYDAQAKIIALKRVEATVFGREGQ